ncbi:Citrate synthase, glyoxysomal [Arachis hypogaea]|nr:Citrate synthase, glyoxysomal [Arachis hypogaea]
MAAKFLRMNELKDQGLDVYNSKQVRDKQIARIIRKITTIAAAIYLRMAGWPPVLPSNQLSYTENFLYMLDSLKKRILKQRLKVPPALNQFTKPLDKNLEQPPLQEQEQEQDHHESFILVEPEIKEAVKPEVEDQFMTPLYHLLN